MNKKKLVGINDTLVNNERASIGDSIVTNEDIVNDSASEREHERSQCHVSVSSSPIRSNDSVTLSENVSSDDISSSTTSTTAPTIVAAGEKDLDFKWDEGRRIVNLKQLAQDLNNCRNCTYHLSLLDTNEKKCDDCSQS